jgi:hypothetical protein
MGRSPASRRRNRLQSQPRPPPSVPPSTPAPPRIHCRRPSASRRSSPPWICARAVDLGILFLGAHVALANIVANGKEALPTASTSTTALAELNVDQGGPWPPLAQLNSFVYVHLLKKIQRSAVLLAGPAALLPASCVSVIPACLTCLVCGELSLFLGFDA